MIGGSLIRCGAISAAFVVALAVLTAAAIEPRAQTPVQEFRVQSTAVILSVSVTSGDRPVRGLGASDFSVTDNGVPQRISRVDFEQVPIDVTLVIDLSSSALTALEQERRDADRILSVLRPIDRARVLVFQDDVYELLPLQAVNGQRRFAPPALLRGRSSLFDAIIAALIAQPESGRRRLTVAITHGEDRRSVNGVASLYEVARASDAVLHVIGVHPSKVPTGSTVEFVGSDGKVMDPLGTRRPFALFVRGSMTKDDWEALENVPELTGGAFHGPRHDSKVDRNVDVTRVFREVFEQFRQGYVVTYQPDNVTGGWHEIAVSVKGVNAKGVRARKGYFAGSQ